MYTFVCMYTYMCSLLFSHSKVNVNPQLTPNICADLHVLDANNGMYVSITSSQAISHAILNI